MVDLVVFRFLVQKAPRISIQMSSRQRHQRDMNFPPRHVLRVWDFGSPSAFTHGHFLAGHVRIANINVMIHHG